MIAFCPIMSFQKEYSEGVLCLEKNCAFADEAGECLIRQALQCYVSAARTKMVDDTEDLKRKMKMMQAYPTISPYSIEPSSDCSAHPIEFFDGHY